jgi:hypothetical protein
MVGDPGLAERNDVSSVSSDDPVSPAMTAMPRVVLSSTLEAPLSWASTELVGGYAVEAVREMNGFGWQAGRFLRPCMRLASSCDRRLRGSGA